MKKAIITLVSLLISTLTIAQSPQLISYQAVVRNADNALVTSQNIGMKASIFLDLGGFIDIKYSELHSPTTNANGLVTIEVGAGTDTTGSFTDLDWAHNKYFIRTQIDLNGGTNYTILTSSQILTVPYAFHAQTADEVTGKRYKVGDFAQGGIVFWVDETGEHGLVCAKRDAYSINCLWGSKSYTGTFGGGGIYAGKANTATINAILISLFGGTHTATGYCSRYGDNESDYRDWYLPSLYELDLMYQNKATIDAIATAHGGDTFEADWYWSSTEASFESAYAIRFSDGLSGSRTKDNYNYESYVRAIRSF